MEQQRNAKIVCSHIGLALFTMFVVWQASAMMIQFGLVFSAEFLATVPWVSLAVSSGALYLLGVPAFLLILRFVPDGPVRPRAKQPFGVGRFALVMVFCLGASWLINILANLLILLLQMVTPSFGGGLEGMDELLVNGPSVVTFLLVVLLPAVGEEFLFRYMIRRKMNGCSDKTYIFFSALCFAFFHANFAQTLFTFLAGAMFAWVYVITGKLWLPMIMHFLVNFTGTVITPLVTRSEVGTLVLFGVMIFFIIAAVVLFCVFRRRVFSTMRPAWEAGWVKNGPPWQTPGQPMGGAVYGGYPAYPVYDGAYSWQGPVVWRYDAYGRLVAVPVTGGQPVYALPGIPHYGSGYYGTGVQGQPQTAFYQSGYYGAYNGMPPGAPYAPPTKTGTAGLCLGNVGMILFLCAAGLMTLLNLIIMILI
ncbi:CPBP family intramembrane metalloprotease [Clostridia bacterium OttesenSCG-928-O13]|nr:CPBP family intramembrane metalloprotease [Clostridia bacterium OttesenSCG-928-O13]